MVSKTSYSLLQRKQHLKSLWSSIEMHEQEILDALHSDLAKPEAEALLHEIFVIKKEIQHALKNLRNWTAKRYVSTPLAFLGTRHFVKAEPKGRVLIIAPWNFPLFLTFRPLVGAIASGNRVVVKPSEHTPATSELIKKIISSTFDKDHIEVVLGGPDVAAKLTSSNFNHINFTGGSEIGRKVMESASKHLCSVTLELGGKSPVIVDKTANLNNAAIRISWGKYLNSGQSCIAPDYMLVEETIKSVLISKLLKRISDMYGDSPIDSPDLGKIANVNHYNRILSLIKNAEELGATLHVPGGQLEKGETHRRIAPCILTNCTPDMAIMKEEIFGPVLPILSWEKPEDVLEIISHNPHPLALYIFSSNRKKTNWFIENTCAGTTAINEVILQVANPALPFGGIQSSGIGRTAGKDCFDSFSNMRSFVAQTTRFNPLSLTFPPFNNFSLTLVRLIRRWF